MSAPSVDFHKTIEETFFARIRAIYPGIKIYTPNAKWTEPVNEIFIALHILNGEGFNTAIGNAKWERHPFVIHIAVYAPGESNERQAWERAESAARIFANTEIRLGPQHKALFRAPSVQAIPDPQQPTKYRVIGKVPGWRDYAPEVTA